MNLEEQLLSASIRNTIQEAQKAAWRLSDTMHGNTLDNIEHGPHADQLAEEGLVLEYYVEKVFRDTAVLAERLGLPLYRKDIMSKMKSFKNLADLAPTPWDVHLHSEPLSAARSMYDSLAIMTEGREVTGLGVFETILENTPGIIHGAKLTPNNEANVKRQVLKILRYAFRDAVSEIPLTKNLKTYKPDIGVKSLMAAAEYKFIDSKSEAKKALDGIYTDMRGYTGHPEWRSFYAVLYMTSPFYTQKDVEHEFRLVKADLSWTPMVLVGPGSRKT